MKPRETKDDWHTLVDLSGGQFVARLLAADEMFARSKSQFSTSVYRLVAILAVGVSIAGCDSARGRELTKKR